MKIRDLDFGKIDANNEFLDKGDDKYLESFYDYDKYHISEFKNGKRYYICGNKGTGKTALLKYLEAEFRKNTENLVYSIRFKSDIDEVDRQDLRKGRGKVEETIDEQEINIENAKYADRYVGIWQVFLIRKMLQESTKGEYGIFVSSRELEKMKKLLDAIYGKDYLKLIPKLKRGKVDFNLKVLEKFEAELATELELNSDDNKVDFERIAKLIDSLYSSLTWYRSPVYVLIDELELSVITGKARRQDIALVRDLIIAVNRLNEISIKKEYRIHFIASIREEVINDIQVAGMEINKCVEDFGISINWLYKGGSYTESPLLKMIERKIHASEKEMGVDPSEDVWGNYFPSIINEEECRKYILGYTWQKPRDIVRLLGLAQQEAGVDDTVFTQEMFDRVLQKYSSNAWNEICEELVLSYSREQLGHIKELFTGIALPFRVSDLDKRLSELSEIHGDEVFAFLKDRRQLIDFLNVMYRWGVIGNTGKRMQFSFLGYDQLDLTGAMVIHKPLRNFFAVKARNAKERAL